MTFVRAKLALLKNVGDRHIDDNLYVGDLFIISSILWVLSPTSKTCHQHHCCGNNQAYLNFSSPEPNFRNSSLRNQSDIHIK